MLTQNEKTHSIIRIKVDMKTKIKLFVKHLNITKCRQLYKYLELYCLQVGLKGYLGKRYMLYTVKLCPVKFEFV